MEVLVNHDQVEAPDPQLLVPSRLLQRLYTRRHAQARLAALAPSSPSPVRMLEPLYRRIGLNSLSNWRRLGPVLSGTSWPMRLPTKHEPS
jgi:hypothetical protein